MTTKTETHCAHITPAGGNIFADLGFEPDEATRLHSETDAIIAAKLARQAGSSQGLDVLEVRETMGKLLKAARRDE